MTVPIPRERILLMGSPGSGKTEQLIRVARYLETLKKRIFVFDLEDKISAYLQASGDAPKNMDLQVAVSWEELRDCLDHLEKNAKPEEWIGIDRIDLSWAYVQRWFTQKKYGETLATKLLEQSLSMGKKKTLFVPPLDRGSWQIINEEYEDMIDIVLYKSRCNVVVTTGIRGVEEDNPLDLYGNLGVAPRGQKEIGHQPHSVFLLSQKRENKVVTWYVTTAKDLPKRPTFDNTVLYDFSLQYLSEYVK